MTSFKSFKFIFIFCLITQLSAQKQTITQAGLLRLTGQCTDLSNEKNFGLIEEVAIAFEKMKQAAAEDGIQIKIVSSSRSFERQLAIWNAKYTQNKKDGLNPTDNINKIIEYSTIPGTSRHHWGTELDLVDAKPLVEGDVLLAHLFEDQGPYASFKKWMDINSNSFGFYLVYTNDINRKGFKYEPWHYSYAPLSKPFLNEYLKINLDSLLNNKKILGREYFTEEFIENYLRDYVLDISPKLK